MGVTSHSSQHPWATKQVPMSCFCDSAFHLRLGPSQDACLPTFFGEWLGNSDPRDGRITKMCCYTLIPRSLDGLTTVNFDMIWPRTLSWGNYDLEALSLDLVCNTHVLWDCEPHVVAWARGIFPTRHWCQCDDIGSTGLVSQPIVSPNTLVAASVSPDTLGCRSERPRFI